MGNLYLYVILLSPVLFYLRNNPENPLFRFLKTVLKHPAGISVFLIPFIAEVELVNPEYFEAYALTPHGFWLGMLAFFSGFIFISLKDDFWQAVQKVRYAALGIAFVLCLVRMIVFRFQGPHILTVIEFLTWLFAVFGFGSSYLNKKSSTLSYLNQAVYPVYIVHMIFMSLAAYLFLSQPTSVDHVTIITSVEVNSPVSEAGLITGDGVVVIKDREKLIPGKPVSFDVFRDEAKMEITVTPNSSGEIGASFSPIPLFVPRFSPVESSTSDAFIQFILISLFTFSGSLLVYEFIIKRIRWIRPLFGLRLD